MGIKVDLNKASRETLLTVIAERQGTIIRLQRRIEELEMRVSPESGLWVCLATRRRPRVVSRMILRREGHASSVPTALPSGVKIAQTLEYHTVADPTDVNRKKLIVTALLPEIRGHDVNDVADASAQ